METREKHMKLSLKHWGRNDRLIFFIEFKYGSDNLEMEFIVEEGKKPYIRPFNIEKYESQINKLEDIYDKECLEIRETLVKWFKEFEFEFNKKFDEFADTESKKLFPIRMCRGNKEEIEFIFKRNEVMGEEFSLIYCSKKKNIVDLTLDDYINRKKFRVKIGNTIAYIFESKYLRSLLKNALEKEAEIWISKEREIRLGSLYK